MNARATDSERAAAAFAELVVTMDRLRSPGGCPWDAEQTHASLAPYAIEEAYEVAEAAESGAGAALREELGDLLFQPVFQARIAQEGDDPWDIADVVEGLVAKLRFRHPHVFGRDGDDDDAEPAVDAAAVRGMWDELKAAEHEAKGNGRRGVLDGIPASLPALARAQKVMSRARKAGYAVGPDPDAPADDLTAEIGADVLAVVARAAALGVDAEAALRGQVRAVERQVLEAEAAAGG
ncbi:MazG family protein [Beutenbergia cavernae DSM 12333]|uniref:MazG family protein n=1 Tax=Beutenbergia cavernae (strain ATCC BAA-8 / DSM 12333 / CCUG 43141 / JCM 11478 / NBRC 16432 / NCIMB 13614 / HKI 0122) TaxID=471853 RepID=C5C092_BEUC1|nr:MazG nucleotide pyrophosphohydrolase domain-containing protein [Beutenbergia cavernae]ACQ79278.1 MazG family protein [Beutenbergia cavernae DSM 12333]